MENMVNPEPGDMKPELVEPSMDLENAYLDYVGEWENSGEKMVPFAAGRQSLSFEAQMRQWEESKTDKAYDKGFVPATLYFLVMSLGTGDASKDARRIIGALHFRHELNEYLLLHSGHIGYGIRPSERRKGYGALMLGTMLDILKERNFGRALIICDDGNHASARTIERNGGLLENIVAEGTGKTRRYWIQLETGTLPGM